jgi:predicted MFS family arabinose efflux permease
VAAEPDCWNLARGTGKSVQMTLLALAAAASTYGRTALGPVQEALKTALQLSDAQVGVLQGSAQALPMLVAAMPLGVLIDRSSRVRLLMVFLLLNLFANVLTAFAPDFAILVSARCLVGVVATATMTTAFSMVADLYEPALRGRRTMVLVVSQMVGNALAFLVGGVLLSMWGSGDEGWRRAMLGLALPLAPAAVALWFLQEPVRTAGTEDTMPLRTVGTALWRYRGVLASIFGGMVMLETAFVIVYVWAAPLLSRSYGLTPDRVGAMMATGMIISGIAGPIAGGALADFCQRTGGPRRTLLYLGVFALMSAPLGLYGVASSVHIATLLLILFMVLVSGGLVAGTALLTIVIPSGLRGLSMALLLGIEGVVALGAAPVTVSLVSESLGGPAMLGQAMSLANVVVGAVGAAAFFLGRHFVGDPQRLA